MSWITEHLMENDEIDFDPRDDEPILYGDAVSDEEWASLAEMRDDEGDETPFYDEEGPYFGEDDDHRDPIESSLYRGRL